MAASVLAALGDVSRCNRLELLRRVRVAGLPVSHEAFDRVLDELCDWEGTVVRAGDDPKGNPLYCLWRFRPRR